MSAAKDLAEEDPKISHLDLEALAAGADEGGERKAKESAAARSRAARDT